MKKLITFIAFAIVCQMVGMASGTAAGVINTSVRAKNADLEMFTWPENVRTEAPVFYGPSDSQADEVTLEVDLTWNPETERPITVMMVRKGYTITADINGIPDNAKGFTIPIMKEWEDVYHVIIVFQRIESVSLEGRTALVVTENCDLTKSEHIVVDAASADRLVSFVSFLPSGEEAALNTYSPGDDGLEMVEEGNLCVAGLNSILIYDDYVVYDRSVSIDGKLEFPEEFGVTMKDLGLHLADIYINQLSERWKICHTTELYGNDKALTAATAVVAHGPFETDAEAISNNVADYYGFQPNLKLPESVDTRAYLVVPGLYGESGHGAFMVPYMLSPSLSVCLASQSELSPLSAMASVNGVSSADMSYVSLWKTPRIEFDRNSARCYYATTIDGMLAINGITNTFVNIPALNAPVDNATVIGATSPFAVVRFDKNYSENKLLGRQFTPAVYVTVAGSLGEQMLYQRHNMETKITLDGENIGSPADLNNMGLYEFEKFKSGKYEMRLDISDFYYGNIQGHTRVESKWNIENADKDFVPPTVTYLQVKTTGGVVMNEFDNPDDGVICLTAGDFEPKLIVDAFKDEETGETFDYPYYDCGPVSVKLEYSPYGYGSFEDMDVEEVADNYQPRGFGYFYQTSLSDIRRKSANGWYDLRITVADETGNTQTQTISPAFMIRSNVGIVDVEAEGCREIKTVHNVMGVRLDSMQPGLNIVSYSDGTVRKVLVK